METFKNQLEKLGYTLEILRDVGCSHLNGNYFIFTQMCTCCASPDGKPHTIKSIQLPWSQWGKYCEDCVDSELGIIGCGGHYTDGRVFNGQKDVSKDFWIGSISDLDPEEIVDESDSDE